MKIWKLKKGHDARLRSRHPWVFSNELLDSPKSVKPGEPVEVRDYNGQFLARGYGNPHSLISFRALSFTPQDANPLSVDSLVGKLFSAWKLRNEMGFFLSFRVCFSEADGIPGLVFDRYVFEQNNKTYQVYSYQLLTSGTDTAFKTDDQWKVIFEKLTNLAKENGFSNIAWSETFILQRNDVNIRKLEGLLPEAPAILKKVDDIDLTDIQIQVQNVLDVNEKIYFKVDLIDGQKTGFFLDQTFNMKLLLDFMKMKKDTLKGRPVKVLDLCCYMGQWSAQIVANLKKWGLEADVHLVDVSDLALKKASENLSKYGAKVTTYKTDVLDGLAQFSEGEFDIVISDPPAFVKNKKDIHQGLHAYFKLNAQAFRVARKDGVVISCTCSGLVTMEDFKESLRKAVLRSGKTARCILMGGQGWDHPTLMSFPEGFYLKMVMHQLS
ncbi:MAG: class I SAM-dependent rRNA methyltransferase [Bdellovibrio sp.]|nr:class I SAM-dependent rRNA methyltransferase [Bdellovibrio sp.]